MNKQKIWIFDFDESIIRTHTHSLGYINEENIESLKELDDVDFMNTFFGVDEEEYRLFLTVVLQIVNNNDIIYIASFCNKSIIIEIVHRYFKILKFDFLIGFFGENNIVTGKVMDNKNDMIVSIVNSLSIDLSDDIVYIDDNLNNIMEAKTLGITTYYIDNEYRNPIGIHYIDFMKLGLLPHRKLLYDTNNKNNTMTKIINGKYYSNKEAEIAKDVDLLTLENHSDHPFGTYSLESKNGDQRIYHHYNTTMLWFWVKKNKTDPLTGVKIPKNIIERIKFYNKIQSKTDKISYSCISDYFNDFINDLKDGIFCNELYYPHVFVTIESMIGLFNDTFGTTMTCRQQTEEILNDRLNGTWLLRQSSLIGDADNYTFVVSIKQYDNIIHNAYIMRKGYGIGILNNVNRGTVIANLDIDFDYKTLYGLLKTFDWKMSIYFNTNNNKV